MSTVETGIVKFFNSNETKRFGFLVVLDEDGNPTQEEIFFHYGDGRFLMNDGESVLFGSATTTPDGLYRMRDPQKDEKLVFERAKGKGGKDKASPWSTTAQHERQVEFLARRPSYRVVHRATYYGKPEETKVEWEGQNPFELSAKYPKEEPGYGRRRGYDALGFGHADGTDMQWNRSLERQKSDGSWVAVYGKDDPRVFLCCVPAGIYRDYGPQGRQATCFHSAA